ncbi:F-box/FBD/LRR-repeat protein At1g13570-like [Nicotiana sylvestris]|uniref:F-box/FBD/LRR-repeat protein At1g13570-like n=1 Tax=Nicotiana sylvestris TaxID=4096 RepID=A0A1U7YLG6_NICSY|nr:PREDICTED: F-box/FBD/LRR-repeat protein At1g13570-like [Nicotiana sylvestris]
MNHNDIRGKPYKLPASFFRCVHLRHLSLEDCLISHPPSFRGFERIISLKLYNVTILYTLLGRLISHCPLLEQLVLHLPDNYRGIIEVNAPILKSLDFIGRVWFISLKIVPLLAQLSLALRGGYILEAKPHYTRFFESFCALEHLYLDNHSVKLLVAGVGEVPTNLPFRVDCVKNLYLFDLYLSELYSVACALCLMRSFPYLEYMKIKVDNSGVPIALDNIDLEGSFGETTFNNLSIIVIRSIRGTNPYMQLLKLLLAKSSALTRIIIKALTYEDYEILKSVIEHSEFRCASPDTEVVLNY